MAARRLSSLTPAERRVLGIAQATSARPEALVLDAPLADLDEPGQELVAYVLQRAAAQRRLLCSARGVPAAGSERGLIDALQQVLILENGRLLAAGSPSELFAKSAVYRVSAIGAGALFRGELERRGCRVFSLSLGQVDGDGESTRLLVRLPDSASADAILDAALAAEAGIIEMIPVQTAQADLDALGAS
jgi:energy-coupling factor transporter ATP-binding protein EcfA2